MGLRRCRTWPPRHLRCEAAFAALALLFGGCHGDFGRPRPSIFSIDRPAWIGSEAARALDEPASLFPLTDEETLLRELAYPLIRPPYSRQRWYLVLGEFIRTSVVPFYGEVSDYRAYALKLLAGPFRSASSRYGQLLEDIRNDLVRLDPFIAAGLAVLDLDRKRERSFAYVSGLTVDEAANAAWRMRENALILAWVQHCLGQRAAAYRYTLERIIIQTPSPQGVEAERALIELESRIANMYAGWAVMPGGAALVRK